LNLQAIHSLLPGAALCGVEINKKAVESLKKIPRVEVANMSLLEYPVEKKFDLSFVKGVLIHINPDKLSEAYSKLYDSSKRYICIAEYYNPSPVSINYRGHSEKLFKRDFAGDFLKQYPNCKLLDYSFVYHLDPVAPQDDITWFLFEKTT
jgi:spore coat polysaccharide biosynthesis protein SpsF